MSDFDYIELAIGNDNISSSDIRAAIDQYAKLKEQLKAKDLEVERLTQTLHDISFNMISDHVRNLIRRALNHKDKSDGGAL